MVYLFDIEGTVSSLDFVKSTLFPYSRAKLEAFYNQSKVDGMNELRGRRTVEELISFIDQDVKDPDLKWIQGHIWQEGFENGELVAPLFDDAYELFCRISKDQPQSQIAIYSSGSELAQRLFFRHSDKGDLSSMISGYFDLNVGSKLEAQSYVKISLALRCESPGEILFFSDVVLELDAAQSAGCQTVQVRRNQQTVSHRHQCVESFLGFSLPSVV